MTTDLWMLLAAALLLFLLVLTSATPKILINGLPWALGNREGGKDMPAWVDRTDRTVANMLENLPLFVILVLVAHVSGTADGTSALGAMIFVGARVAHAGVYIAGIHVLRTLIWVVSLVGLGMIAYAIMM